MFGIPMPVFTSQLLLLIAPPALCQSPSIVSTPQGIYHPNTSIPGVEQFLGIRYAEPPVGALRFAAPVPYASGDAAQHIDATRYGPACLQDAGFEAANGLSEDCLTLNIFRPASIAPNTSTSNYTTATDDDDGGGGDDTNLLPVLVYIYGGANIGGQARHYSAANLVLHSLGLLPPPPPPAPVPLNHTTTTRAPPATPVLTITLNYRTGALGFLANTLFARRGLLNAGLKDQRLALQWVRDHVRAFGGDPARVTVFGQSAGAFDVWMQVRYEAYHHNSAGRGALFRGAILESGGPGSLALRGVEPRMGDAFLRGSAEALGCTGGTDGDAGDEAALECLRGVGTARLMEVWFDARSPLYNTLDAFVQLPVGFGVDGEWVGGEDYWDEAAAQIPMVSSEPVGAFSADVFGRGSSRGGGRVRSGG
ncbi:Lipase 1 [Diplodia seriata]|uniref:Carboxylic ester hydrolase n=1 Tax=Diplodia seriata TaxID=420778 RepID=A0A1S8B9Y0_9PEZI|nr:Lipase 1 [Diplodia seriata]